MKTFHASPERSSPKVVDDQFQSLLSNTYLSELINALPYVVTILNADRQIVFSNQALLDSLKVSDFKDLLGRRPGEALKCIHSNDMPGGCGTSESCRFCGAVNAITTSMKENRKVVNECRITSENDDIEEFYDFEVTATPFTWQGGKYTIFALADISGLKRKLMLERIFFHDILNTAGNLKGLSELIVQLEDSPKKEQLLSVLTRVSNELVAEIQDQRQLSAAESGELQVNLSLVNVNSIFENIIDQFRSNNQNSNHLIIADDSQDLSFSTDINLLTRILKNMTKNAIEASTDEDLISLKATHTGSTIRFTVHNPNVIPKNTQLQIFKRSFSTKGTDRGLGTYSMKLLGERYLKGRVSFKSEEGLGTEFYFDLPL